MEPRGKQNSFIFITLWRYFMDSFQKLEKRTLNRLLKSFILASRYFLDSSVTMSFLWAQLSPVNFHSFIQYNIFQTVTVKVSYFLCFQSEIRNISVFCFSLSYLPGAIKITAFSDPPPTPNPGPIMFTEIRNWRHGKRGRHISKGLEHHLAFLTEKTGDGNGVRESKLTTKDLGSPFIIQNYC